MTCLDDLKHGFSTFLFKTWYTFIPYYVPICHQVENEDNLLSIMANWFTYYVIFFNIFIN
jgi:hypothetical protein